MNQVIFADGPCLASELGLYSNLRVAFTPISDILDNGSAEILDKPDEDFIIQYMTPSKTIKTIEVNRETLSIQKIDSLNLYGGEYSYEVSISGDPAEEGAAVQVIRQDAVPHQRNSWYIELTGSNAENSFYNQLKVIAKSSLLNITEVDADNESIVSNSPLTFKFHNVSGSVASKEITKSPYQYLQMLLTKHVQNFGYNHTDDNAELNSGLADYKAWIAGTEADDTVAIHRLRFATNRKASKTRDERVWQNVYICTKGEDNTVAAFLDAYIAIMNGEETEGGE